MISLTMFRNYLQIFNKWSSGEQRNQRIYNWSGEQNGKTKRDKEEEVVFSKQPITRYYLPKKQNIITIVEV